MKNGTVNIQEIAISNIERVLIDLGVNPDLARREAENASNCLNSILATNNLNVMKPSKKLIAKITNKIEKTELEVSAIITEIDKLTRGQQKLWAKHSKKTELLRKLRALLAETEAANTI